MTDGKAAKARSVPAEKLKKNSRYSLSVMSTQEKDLLKMGLSLSSKIMQYSPLLNSRTRSIEHCITHPSIFAAVMWTK